MRVKVCLIYYHMIKKKRMSAPYREVASRLKKLLATGRVIARAFLWTFIVGFLMTL